MTDHLTIDSNEDLESFMDDSIKDIDLGKAPSSQLFTDTSFPPDVTSLVGSRDTTQKLAKAVSSWERVTNIEKDAQLFLNGVESGDVIQGAIGDCWFLGALSCVALRPHILNHLFVEQFIGQSRFTLRFFKDGKWKNVVIDNYLPVDQYKNLVFARCKDDNEFWVPLAEKAYAKLNGSYKATESGFTQEGLVDLTGGVGYRFDITPKDGYSDDIWNKILDCNKPEYMMGTMISSSGAKNETEVKSTGLLSGHAYGLLQCVVVNDTKLVQIRNPWGQKEWKGKWSDSSSEWDKVSMEDKKRIGYKIEDDGSFFMSYVDFCNYWTSVEVCRVFYKEKYLKQQFEGEFSTKLGTSESYASISGCPQYVLTVEGNQQKEFCISVLQSDKRVISNKKTQNVCFGMRIYKTVDGKAITKNVTHLASVPFWTWDREIVLEVKLDPGKYIIVPSTHKSGMESKFWIRVYGDSSFSLDQVNPSPNQNDPIYASNLEANKKMKYTFLNKNQKIQNNQQNFNQYNNQQNFNQNQNQYQNNNQYKNNNQYQNFNQNNNQNFNQIKSQTIQYQPDNSSSLHLYASQDINISNNNLTAEFGGKSDASRTFYGSKLFESGKHYFAFKIEGSTSPSNIMIGVADPYVHNNKLAFLSHGPRGYGFYGYDGTGYHNFQAKNYATKWGKGDEIGVSLDLDQGALSFYLNGKSFGPCYTGVQGPFVAAVTLYSPGDKVTLLPNAKLPQQNSSATSLKDGSKVVLKSVWGIFMMYTNEGVPTASTSAGSNNNFTVSKKQSTYEFIDSKGFKLTAKKGDTEFYVTETSINQQSVFTLQSQSGDFIGMNKKGDLLLYSSSESNQTKWLIPSASENPVYNILKQDDVIALKSYFGTYFGYNKSGNPIVSTQQSDDTTFTVHRSGDFYKLKSKHGFFAVCSQSDHNLFNVTQHQSGYSFESHGKYLGVSKEGKVLIYDTENAWEVRFYPETVSEIKSSLSFSNGSRIAFKTIWGTYFYYDHKGVPIGGPLDQLSVFTVEQHGSYYKFRTQNKTYACTRSGNTLFSVNQYKKGYSLKAGEHYLGVTKEGKVNLYKSEDEVTCFVIEDAKDLEKTIQENLKVIEQKSQMNITQQTNNNQQQYQQYYGSQQNQYETQQNYQQNQGYNTQQNQQYNLQQNNQYGSQQNQYNTQQNQYGSQQNQQYGSQQNQYGSQQNNQQYYGSQQNYQQNQGYNTQQNQQQYGSQQNYQQNNFQGYNNQGFNQFNNSQDFNPFYQGFNQFNPQNFNQGYNNQGYNSQQNFNQGYNQGYNNQQYSQQNQYNSSQNQQYNSQQNFNQQQDPFFAPVQFNPTPYDQQYSQNQFNPYQK